MKTLTKIAMALFLFASLTAAQTKWKLDKAHSSIGFTIEHMVISTVDGKFQSYEGDIETSNDSFEGARINFTADVASIDTDNERRDNHLKSDDFFNAEQFPKLTFVGKSMTKVDENKFKLVGDLTIRDVTKEVVLDVDYRGTANDPWGNSRVGFKISGVVNRFDYNLKWDKVIEAGGLIAGKNVQLNLNIELIKESKS